MIVYSISKINPNVISPALTLYQHSKMYVPFKEEINHVDAVHPVITRPPGWMLCKCICILQHWFEFCRPAEPNSRCDTVTFLYFAPQNASAGVSRMLLGNKCDIEAKRKVSRETGEKVRCGFLSSPNSQERPWESGNVTVNNKGSGSLGKDWGCHFSSFFFSAPMFTLDEKQEMIIGHILAACN